MDEDCETIEYDYINAKDQFNNTKFAFRERFSKLFFYDSICNEDSISNSLQIENCTKIMETTKNQLKEVKREYDTADEEIKELSKQIYEIESIDMLSEINSLKTTYQSLLEENERLSELKENLVLNENLTDELDKINKEIKHYSTKIEQSKRFIASDTIESMESEELKLRKDREELTAKIKRLTEKNTENDIEEVYYWYEKLTEFYMKLFGECRVYMEGISCIIEISIDPLLNSSYREIKIILENKQLVNILCDECDEEFEIYRNYCILLNDPSPILGLIYIKLSDLNNLQCSVDSDCRVSTIPDFNSLFCVDNRCSKLQGPGSSCNMPEDCSSFLYFGPLACSSQCKKGKECSRLHVDPTSFCCKSIPKMGDCNIDRPGILSGCANSHVCSLVDGKSICVEKTGKSWILGMLCSVFGNLFINIGINFQKKSYVQSYIRIFNVSLNTLIFGSVIYGIGKLVSFTAYIFGNQSMLAGLSATGLVSNSIFAPLINNETFTWKDVIAILFVFTGSTIIMANTSRSHIIYTLCELIKMYKQTGTIVWFLFIFFAIIMLFLFIKFVEVNSDWHLINDSFSFLQTDAFFPEDGYVCKYFIVFAYVGLSSFIASFTTLSAKSLGEIIDKTIGGENQFTQSITYVFLFSLILCTLLQIYWLNRALKHFDALLVIPIFHISWTILSILTAGIYFQDFDHFSTSQFRNFLFGIVVIFGGSIFLGFRIVNKNPIRTRQIHIPECQYKKD